MSASVQRRHRLVVEAERVERGARDGRVAEIDGVLGDAERLQRRLGERDHLEVAARLRRIDELDADLEDLAPPAVEPHHRALVIEAHRPGLVVHARGHQARHLRRQIGTQRHDLARRRLDEAHRLRRRADAARQHVGVLVQRRDDAAIAPALDLRRRGRGQAAPARRSDGQIVANAGWKARAAHGARTVVRRGRYWQTLLTQRMPRRAVAAVEDVGAAVGDERRTGPGRTRSCGVHVPFLVHTLATQTLLPPQASLPQRMTLLQPSGMRPQSLPSAAQVVGVQPHELASVPPPQLLGQSHEPQSSMPPQPSEAGPQLLPSAAQVVGVQPHTLATPPPPQRLGRRAVAAVERHRAAVGDVAAGLVSVSARRRHAGADAADVGRRRRRRRSVRRDSRPACRS